MTKNELRELTNAQLADRLYHVADRMANQFGQNPDSDLLREAGSRYWTDGKADEEKAKKKPGPKPAAKKTTTRKAQQ